MKALGMTIQEKSGQDMTILNNTSLKNPSGNFGLHLSHPTSEGPFQSFSSSSRCKATNIVAESETSPVEVSIDSNAPSPFSANRVCQRAS